MEAQFSIDFILFLTGISSGVQATTDTLVKWIGTIIKAFVKIGYVRTYLTAPLQKLCMSRSKNKALLSPSGEQQNFVIQAAMYRSATEAALTGHLTLQWLVAIYWSLSNKAALSSEFWLALLQGLISCITD